MLILLPPSESKSRPRRGRAMDREALSFPGLNDVRVEVADTLARVSAETDAPARLGLGPSLWPEIEGNTRLETVPAAPVHRLYTGVLYDALDLPSLDGPARARATRWIVVASALYGAVRLTDRVAPYRLSMTTPLPGLPPLARVWREPLSAALVPAAGSGIVLDCRSTSYAAAWPLPPALADRWVRVRVPGASHQAKHVRGLVARAVCRTGVDSSSVPRLAQSLNAMFDVRLEPGHGWVLNVSA